MGRGPQGVHPRRRSLKGVKTQLTPPVHLAWEGTLTRSVAWQSRARSNEEQKLRTSYQLLRVCVVCVCLCVRLYGCKTVRVCV